MLTRRTFTLGLAAAVPAAALAQDGGSSREVRDSIYRQMDQDKRQGFGGMFAPPRLEGSERGAQEAKQPPAKRRSNGR
jgi:hypothetical protein